MSPNYQVIVTAATVLRHGIDDTSEACPLPYPRLFNLLNPRGISRPVDLLRCTSKRDVSRTEKAGLELDHSPPRAASTLRCDSLANSAAPDATLSPDLSRD